MMHRHAVDIVRESEGDVSHVEAPVDGSASMEQFQVGVAQYLSHQLAVELIVAGRNRRMGGEDAVCADSLNVLVGWAGSLSGVQLPLEQAEGQQRGMALVHVVDIDLLMADGL